MGSKRMSELTPAEAEAVRIKRAEYWRKRRLDPKFRAEAAARSAKHRAKNRRELNAKALDAYYAKGEKGKEQNRLSQAGVRRRRLERHGSIEQPFLEPRSLSSWVRSLGRFGKRTFVGETSLDRRHRAELEEAMNAHDEWLESLDDPEQLAA
ncbi:MAG: hypothetical protein AB7T07_13280 [Steroidobacteraceae bacterium]